MTILERPDFWHDVEENDKGVFLVFDYEVGVTFSEATRDDQEEFIFHGCVIAKGFRDCVNKIIKNSADTWPREKYYFSILSVTNIGRMVEVHEP